MITPICFYTASIFAPVPGQESLASVCIVSVSLAVNFYVDGVYVDVPLYNAVFGVGWQLQLAL